MGRNEMNAQDSGEKPPARESGGSEDAIVKGRVVEELRQSEERFRRVVGQTNAGVVQADPVGRMTLVNPSWCQMLGYSEAELLQMNIADITYPASLHATQEAVHRLAAGGADFQIEKNYRRKDGSVFMARSSVSALRRPDGDYLGLIAVTLDITDRKRGEALFAEQQRLLERIATGRPLDECLHALCDAVSRLQPNARAAVLMANGDRSAMAGCHSAHLQPTYGASIVGAPINDLAIGTCGTAIFTGEPVTCSDIAGSDSWSQPWRELCLAHGIRACHSTPVFGPEGKAVASFFLCFSEAREPDTWERRIAEFGAHVAGIAIELDRTNELRQRDLEDARRLQEISAQLIQEDNVQALYERILDAAMGILRSDFGSIQMLDPARGNGGELRLLAFRGFTPEAATFWEWVRPTSESTCGVALRTGQQCLVPDVEQCEFMAGSADLETYVQTGIHAVQTTPLLSRSGRLVGMISTHWKEAHRPSERDLRLFDVLARQAADLIERKQAEDALRAGEQETKRARDYAEAILRTSPLPLLVLEKDFRVNTANEAFYHTFQVNPAETQGRLVYELGNGQWNIPKLRELLETILSQRTLFNGFAVTHDFESIGRRTILLNARRMENEPDRPTRIVLVLEDITERKRTEEQLAQLTAELEQRVAERTHELALSEDRLRRLATELNLSEQRERKRLATELHDHLQQMLVLGKLTIGQGKRVAAGLPAVEQILKKVDDIFSDSLTYTRTLVSDLSPTVLRDRGLTAALQWLGTYMQKYNQTVTVTVPDGGDLKLPEDQVILLFQSVRELLINSSKHAGTGEATVRIEQRDGLLRIDVRDEGAGFDLAAAAAAAAAGTPSGGISSKFGLFSIRERMKGLGGRFELDSTPGQGTTATLTLPLRSRAECSVRSPELSGSDDALKAQASALPARSKLRTERSELQKNARLRLLLVDDHAMLRQGLRSILEQYPDLEVIGEAADGEEAVALAHRLAPDVVLMDVTMPKLNGIEATRRIKEELPWMIIIGMSVHHVARVHDEMKAAGASAFVTKEAAVTDLYRAIQTTVR